MYADNEATRRAWQALWDRARADLAGNLYEKVIYQSLDDQNFPDGIFLAHTCGYPYRKIYRNQATALFVPEYDISCAQNGQYCSRFIVHKSSQYRNLADCQNTVVAVNNALSNSGMNVLRHAVASLAGGQSFFSRVLWTGGHRESLMAVASKKASLAAIDCVSHSYHLASLPQICAQIRCIGISEKTMGLPFVASSSAGLNPQSVLAVFNSALSMLDTEQRKHLKIRQFLAIDDKDYDRVEELEQEAVARGYPTLR